MPIKRNQFVTLVLFLVFLVALSTLACRAVTGLPAQILPASGTPSVTLEHTVTPAPLPSSTWTAAPDPSDTPTESPAPLLQDASEPIDPAEFQVRFHPEDALYVGDQVSIEVIPPAGLNLEDLWLKVDLPEDVLVERAEFNRFGIAGRAQVTLTWIWDTSQYLPGEYELEFNLQPGGVSWFETVNLLPAGELPLQLAESGWAEADTECCILHYVTGTAVERDLRALIAAVELQAQDAAAKLGGEFKEPISIIFLSRVLGHGGFASGEIHVSYLDRNYIAGSSEMVIHHEMVHILDASLGGDYRPSLFVEGLAVYLSGGHFKPEPLMPRAAALLDSWGDPAQIGLDWFVPLDSLAEDFYNVQHEIGYLEAAALVEFMVEKYGWESFVQFYRGIEPDSDGPASAIDSALRNYFDISLKELERDFTAALRQLPADPTLITDVRLTVQFFDTVRRYQQALDPSAYFLTAWLVDTSLMRQKEIVADYLRHPDALENIILETMLASGGEYISAGQYQLAELYITAVNAVLDALSNGWVDPFRASLIGSDYRAVFERISNNPDWVGAAAGSRIIPERIWVEDSVAKVWLTVGSAELLEVRLERDSQGVWQFLSFGAQNASSGEFERRNPGENTWVFYRMYEIYLEYAVYGAQ